MKTAVDSQLTDCISNVPQRENRTCHVALSLVRNEITSFEAETKLRADAAELRHQLQDGILQAKRALESKQDEKETIELLSRLLAKAEELPGHYLVSDVHTVRRYLDKLAPIPAVHEQLREALMDAHEAFATREKNLMSETR